MYFLAIALKDYIGPGEHIFWRNLYPAIQTYLFVPTMRSRVRASIIEKREH